MYPGFELDEFRVGMKLSFDTIRLEQDSAFKSTLKIDSVLKISLTENSREAIGLLIREYYEKNPEITHYIGGGETFHMIVKEKDTEIVLQFLLFCLELELTSGVLPQNQDTTKIRYIDALEDIDGYEASAPTWDDLWDRNIDVDEIIRKQVPDGPEPISISKSRYREFVENNVLPPLGESDWPEGAAWSINLALHELREGRYTEAAYAFEAVRNSITKSPTPVQELKFTDLLNKYLISLRDLSIYQSNSENQHDNQELFFSINERPFIFIPEFTSKPTLDDLKFRMTSPVWIANALVFVSAVATGLGAPTISRAEVDPFGSDITHRNTSFVLRSAKNLIELGREFNDATMIEHINLMRIDRFAPQTILKRNFESLGYETVETTHSQFNYQGEDIDLTPDLVFSKHDELFTVYYRPSDPSELANKIEHLEQDVRLILVSDEKFNGKVFELESEYSFIELFYLDVRDEVLRTADSGLPTRKNQPLTKVDVRERLDELYDAVRECDDSQEKGNLLEEFCETLFNRLIDDTEVLRVNPNTGIEEIDIILRNRQESEPWMHLSPIVMVECKNWTKSAGAKVARDFFAKADSVGGQCSSGILISWNGITGRHDRDGAWGYIRDKKQDGFQILCLDGTDMKSSLEDSDPDGIFDERYIELVSEY